MSMGTLANRTGKLVENWMPPLARGALTCTFIQHLMANYVIYKTLNAEMPLFPVTSESLSRNTS